MCVFLPLMHAPLPPPPFVHSSTRLQSRFMNGSSRPAWMLNWRLWRTWPMPPGTSPSPRSSSTWTASPCSLRWWRVGLSKSVVSTFSFCSSHLFCVFFPSSNFWFLFVRWLWQRHWKTEVCSKTDCSTFLKQNIFCFFCFFFKIFLKNGSENPPDEF